MNENPKNAKKSPRKPPKKAASVAAPKSASTPPESSGCVFVAVAQCDFAAQMDVLRYILQSDSYRMCWIKHDKDTFTADEIAERAATVDGKKQDFITRENGDGSKSQYKAGDVKPPHIHTIIQTRSKMRASTLNKRFCGQLHFFLASQKYGDKYEAAHYLTHETFSARDRYKYKRSDVGFSKATPDESAQMYADLMQDADAHLIETVRTFSACKKAAAAAGDDSATKTAVQAFIEMGDIQGLKTIMSRAYFFDKML